MVPFWATPVEFSRVVMTPLFKVRSLLPVTSLATALRKLRQIRQLPIGAGLGAIALLLFLIAPAQATDLQVSPTNPRLGDTIAVVLRPTAPGLAAPTVTMDGTSYPVFPLGGDRYRALLPTTPLDRPGRKVIQVLGMGEPRNVAITLRDRSFPVQRIWVRGGGSGGTEYEFSRVNALKEIVSPEKYWRGPFARPAGGRVSAEYGVRRYYNGVFAENYYHRGVDYAGGQGSPVVAPAAGRVVLVGRVEDGFVLHGNSVGIDHGQGVTSIFIHLSRIDVREGDFVQSGQRIGAIGATGSATGPNLHWGLFVNGKSVDPVPWRNQGFE